MNRMNDDTISRRAAIDALDEYIEEYSFDLDENGYHNPKWCAMQEAKMTIQRLPSAERRGRWIKHPWGGGVHTCSVCGERANVILANGYLTGDASPSGETGGYYHYDRKELLSNYCPNCGARMMDEVEE